MSWFIAMAYRNQLRSEVVVSCPYVTLTISCFFFNTGSNPYNEEKKTRLIPQT